MTVFKTSHLVWGVWIEMTISKLRMRFPAVTPHSRCVDWNITLKRKLIRCSTRHTSHEVCGLKYRCWCRDLPSHTGHTSHEVCELKWYPELSIIEISNASHLVWGVWIEIVQTTFEVQYQSCHISYEVCGLKFLCLYGKIRPRFVTPQCGCVD